jgi:hypothetical protein
MNHGNMLRAIAGASIFLACGAVAHSQAVAPAAADPQSVADRIAKEIEQIRGLPFKSAVKAQNQSTEDFGAYVTRELDEAVPVEQRKHFDKIVRTLGLYRGPVIEDFSGMMGAVMTSQVGAYYDPEKQGFFVLMQDMPELMQGVLYSHELYHAMQDQYFDLTRYMEPNGKSGPAFNADEQLARSSVVEGEASYIMSLWMVQKMARRAPTREIMEQVVSAQANLGMDQLREMIKQPKTAEMLGADMKNAVDASADIPAFIMDTMMGVYLKGLGFVFAVHEQGWASVEKLYTEYPARSTEHILHPEKWLAREAPVAFEWPKFKSVKALREWEMLDDDVLGEFQWRVVFKEHGFGQQAESAAAGWGGDRYAVFKRKDSDATLLLLRTAWDNEAEAKEFADVYGRVQATKYANMPTAVRLVQKGVDVFVVEGGDEAGIDALMKVVVGAKKTAPARARLSP